VLTNKEVIRVLDERKRKILQAIIEDYIYTAEPVGSRTIARKYELGISPATIRNEMADLEFSGFLEQPHTSAGRIPSAKGYRFYVDCLLSPHHISENDVTMINSWFQSKARRLEEVFQETAKVLSRMTRNISLVSAPQTAKSIFKYLQFLPFDSHRVVVVVVTDSGLIENKLLEIPEGTSLIDLQRIAEVLNNSLSGLAFDQIRTPLLAEIKQLVVPDPILVGNALEIVRQALTTDKNKKVYLGGTTQLLSQPEFRDVEKVKGLLTVLEEEKVLHDILDSGSNDGVLVTIGGENKYSGIQDCSMVQATYRADGQVIGTIAILGPTRMEYARIMSVLDFMHGHLGEILKKYQT
jgi:heat-inducible transcriptional repressor